MSSKDDIPTGVLHVKFSIQDMIDELGSPTTDDYRNGFLHLADVAAQNDDVIGLGLIANALGVEEGDGKLPDDVCKSLHRLFVEAMAVGKEFTLRKMCKFLDPHGEWIDVPEEWIGKGAGGDDSPR